MPLSNINSSKVVFSIVDDIVDEYGKKNFMEVRLTKSFFKKLVRNSHNNLIMELQSNFSVTKREAQVLTCLAQGKNNVQIAKKLNVSVHTAKAHIQNIFKKLCVSDRTEAVVKAINGGLIDI